MAEGPAARIARKTVAEHPARMGACEVVATAQARVVTPERPVFVRTVARPSSRQPRRRAKAGLATAAVRDDHGIMASSFDDMTKAERILYVQELWDRIAADPEPGPLTAAQLVEVRRRLAEHDAQPEAAIPWEIAREPVRIRR